MSGGHWDHQQHRVRDCLDDVTRDPEVRKRWPRSARVLADLSDALADVLHDMDWDLSGDSCIEDDPGFDQECINKLTRAVHDCSRKL
jgi:hypothetical protein